PRHAYHGDPPPWLPLQPTHHRRRSTLDREGETSPLAGLRRTREERRAAAGNPYRAEETRRSPTSRAISTRASTSSSVVRKFTKQGRRYTSPSMSAEAT